MFVSNRVRCKEIVDWLRQLINFNIHCLHNKKHETKKINVQLASCAYDIKNNQKKNLRHLNNMYCIQYTPLRDNLGTVSTSKLVR